MKQYRLIGLTGQSGAGKSTAARLLQEHGAVVINADEIVSELYAQGSPCVKTIAACFGSEVIAPDGTPDRQALAARAFSSPENTALLGRIVHPFVTAALLARLRGAQGVVVYDAPQLFESGADVICDCVIAVVAEEKTRLSRIITRDGLSPEAALQRVRAQYGEDFFRANADAVWENNGDEAALAAKVRELIGN